MENKQVHKSIKELSKELNSTPKDVSKLHDRAELFTSIQDHGKAMNDYLAILEIDPADKVAKTKLNLLRSIIKYANIDVYASTNTNMDPWMD